MHKKHFQVVVLDELKRIRHELRKIQREEVQVMAAIDDLETNLASEESVLDGLVTLTGTIKAALDQAIASGDPARIQAVSDKLGADQAKIVAAVLANTPTPVDPNPPPGPIGPLDPTTALAAARKAVAAARK